MMERLSKRAFTMLAAAGLLALSSGVAQANPARHGDPAKKAERQERMQQEMTKRLGASLGLDEAKAKEVADILGAARLARQEAMKTVRAERDALKQLVERKASAKELDAQRARLEAAVANVPSSLEVLSQTGRVLDAEQQAKLAVRLSDHSGKGFGAGKGFKHGKGKHEGEGRGRGMKHGKRAPAAD